MAKTQRGKGFIDGGAWWGARPAVFAYGCSGVAAVSGTNVPGYTRPCKPAGRPRADVRAARGKSGLHRAGRWVTPSRGDPKESATERHSRRPASARARATVKWWGKSPPAAG